ncbi:MAG TPA: glycosyltransferase family 4 protein [Rubricoccaceae bacterium]|nr:glycosyltransferase family 4 protein [Rubricoccaceae bacterium]
MSQTVLNVGHHYRVIGGSDRYLVELGQLLERHGHRVIPFVAAHPDNLPTPWARYFPPAPNTTRPAFGDAVQFLYSKPARAAMRRLLAEVEVDLAHLHVYYGKLTASILAPLREAGLPVVQTLHEYKLLCPVYTFISNGEICEACGGKEFWQALPRRCNQRSVARTTLSVAEAYFARRLGDVDTVTHFIAPSDFLRRKMIEHDVAADRITTVHNFADTERIAPSPSRSGPVVYFGRLERVKGLFTLLEAAALAPEVPLVLVGDGRARPALEAFAAARGLGHVRFLGFQEGEALERVLRESVASVLPAEWYENCPLAVLEAMAYAKPVIGSRIGGIPELVEDGETGFLVAPRDAEALADRLRWIVAHPVQAAEMGRAGRERVERDFSPEVHYARVRAVYDAVARARPEAQPAPVPTA